MLKARTAIELDSANVLFEDESELVLPGVLARAGVLSYAQGRVYRPAAELRRSLFTFGNAFVVAAAHPSTVILTDPDSIAGFVSDVVWDEEAQAVRGRVHIDKHKVSSEFVNQVKAGVLCKNSIGFLYEEDRAAGEWRGQRYDFVQRKILVDHVAVGVPHPRDPGCTLGVDSALEQVGADEFVRDIPDMLVPLESTGASESSRFGRELAMVLNQPRGNKLSVGDLSVCTRCRKDLQKDADNVVSHHRPEAPRHTLGDLSIPTQTNEKFEKASKASPGLTAGNLFGDLSNSQRRQLELRERFSAKQDLMPRVRAEIARVLEEEKLAELYRKIRQGIDC